MPGIYIHIPFCKQACHYCDFHFSTSMKKKNEMVMALAKELLLRKSEYAEEIVETIYFGGGTPSVLSSDEINFLIESILSLIADGRLGNLESLITHKIPFNEAKKGYELLQEPGVRAMAVLLQHDVA